VFDDLAVVVEPEDVDTRIVVVARPVLVAVENHVVVLGDGAFHVDPLAGVFAGHTLGPRQSRSDRHAAFLAHDFGSSSRTGCPPAASVGDLPQPVAAGRVDHEWIQPEPIDRHRLVGL
jgi:hypothetical protein